MARLSTLQLFRARLRGWMRTPWALLLLFAGDLVELGASFALALVSPTPAAPRAPYPVIDLPAPPQQVTLGIAFVGVMAGLLMGAAIVAELWFMVRRAQIFRWRYGRVAPQRGRSRAAVLR